MILRDAVPEWIAAYREVATAAGVDVRAAIRTCEDCKYRDGDVCVSERHLITGNRARLSFARSGRMAGNEEQDATYPDGGCGLHGRFWEPA